jgi:hypothetical protein
MAAKIYLEIPMKSRDDGERFPREAALRQPDRGTPPDCRSGVPPAVSGASRPRFGEVTIRDRGRLSHWEKESATYFITFRLDDSLPKSMLERIEWERQNLVETAKQLNRELSAGERKKLRSTKVVEAYLDKGSGVCHLNNPEIARTIADALLHFDGRRYRLFAWCVLPNHVPAVVRVFSRQSLSHPTAGETPALQEPGRK